MQSFSRPVLLLSLVVTGAAGACQGFMGIREDPHADGEVDVA